MLVSFLVKESRRKQILIDGNSLVYRAFYALPTTLALSSGEVTNAVYGFTAMLIRLLIDEEPDVVSVAFDSRGPTFRHLQYEDYKAHRKPAPDELHAQFPLVKEVLSALAIPIFELKGYEGDDILATLAASGAAAGDDVIVVTGDRDAFQMISDDNVRVMTTRKGITDIVIYDREKVIERYGVTPEQVPDFLALKGDPSDNIPGVPGVGDKTAAKLIQEYGTIEALYEQVEDISRENLRESLVANKEEAEISKKLAILDTKVPLDGDLKDTRVGEWDIANVRKVFLKLEFRTLLDRFETNLASGSKDIQPLTVKIIDLPGDRLASWLKAHSSTKEIGVETVDDAAGQTVGLAIGLIGKDGPKAITFKTSELSESERSELRQWLREKDRVKSVHDLKSKFSPVQTLGLPFEGALFDPFLAAHLVEPSGAGYGLEELVTLYLEKQIPEDSSLAQMAAVKAVASLLIMKPLKAALKAGELSDVFNKIEIPLSKVLARMEACGVGLDRQVLSRLSKEMKQNLDAAAAQIYKLAGVEFNIKSPRQVSDVLFEKLGLTPGRKTKTKTGYTTDAATLAKLASEHAIVPLITEYRENAKLKSTYVDALPKLLDQKTGRLHTSFNQTVTATGRLSSSNPNLQNIPVRSKLGRKIRKAFIPTHKDEKLLAIDYSQIELRLLAHFSNDKTLKQAFKENKDIHTATAAEVFGLSLEDVTPERRRHAKAINFGIIYGISAFGLAEQTGISPEEAKKYIEEYLGRYPGVRRYLEETVKEAYQRGYVTTISGRKRYIRELKSANFNQRSFGERVATNAPLQGSAADIIKLAMINIDAFLAESGLQTRMVLQVHDELVFEVPPMEESIVTPKIVEFMEDAYKLSVPLEVKVCFGRNWDEAK